LETQDKESALRSLSAIMDMLHHIRADGFAKECRQYIDTVKTVGAEKIESNISGFLTRVSNLSINIQMAEHRGAGEDIAPASDEEQEKLILAVDDVALFLNTLKLVIQDMPQYKLTCVTSGSAALSFLLRHKPDLFILDIDMPSMDGYTLAQRIREANHTAPIIFLTGNSSKEYVLKAIEAGGVDFIIKPIDKEHVMQKIQKYI
jgi:CheY-like chemotaxis protein